MSSKSSHFPTRHMHRRKLALNAKLLRHNFLRRHCPRPHRQQAALWIDNDSIRENARAVTKRPTDEIRDKDRLKASKMPRWNNRPRHCGDCLPRPPQRPIVCSRSGNPDWPVHNRRVSKNCCERLAGQPMPRRRNASPFSTQMVPSVFFCNSRV